MFLSEISLAETKITTKGRKGQEKRPYAEEAAQEEQRQCDAATGRRQVPCHGAEPAPGGHGPPGIEFLKVDADLRAASSVKKRQTQCTLLPQKVLLNYPCWGTFVFVTFPE